MATTDELKTPEAKARALREHQQRGAPYDVMDQDIRYFGARWVIEGLSIQILLAPERCADGQRVIVACPDLGQKCECELHEQGDCPGHVAYTKSRVLLSNARGITGWKAICDACQPFWLVALEQKSHDAAQARLARRAARPVRESRRVGQDGGDVVHSAEGTSPSDRVLAAAARRRVTADTDASVGAGEEDDPIEAVLRGNAQFMTGRAGQAQDDVA